jgi:hypothetical protein
METASELISQPTTVLGIGWAVWEILKYIKNQNNFKGLGLSDDEKNQLKFIYDIHYKHHEVNEMRQEKMANVLDDISKTLYKISLVLDNIMDKLNK